MSSIFEMFESATLKLTGWYLLIIMIISILFSVLVYQSASGEIETRLEQYTQGLPSLFSGQTAIDNVKVHAIQQAQAEQAKYNIFISLIYVNILVLAGGGLASYLMAKRTLRPLEEAHETESRFVGDASHELRTPLTAMKTELEVAIKDPKLTKDEMRTILASNLEEVDKLTKLSQTLLNLSKMEYANLEYTQINLNASAQTVIEKYNSEGRIQLEEKHKNISIKAHESSVEELCTILIDNALKYSPQGSKVHIRVSRRAGRAQFKITNSGKGINPKHLPYIFDRFYRADSARTQSEKTSFGLGLSLAKQIVALHDGELTVSSDLNKKTTFYVSLPLYRK